MDTIQSRSHPLFRRFRSVRDGHEREGTLLIEGPRLLTEAVAAGLQIENLLISPEALTTARHASAVATLPQGVVRTAHPELIDSLSTVETSQGLIALAQRPHFDRDAALAQASPFIVILVGVQNPGNVGALLRTAEAAGVHAVFLTEGTADAFSWKALRGAMGSAFRLPHFRLSWDEVTAVLKAKGVRLVATAAKGGIAYGSFDFRTPIALLLGNEGSGLPSHVEAGIETSIHIPVRTPVESLNVAVAAGVLLFEAARQRSDAPAR